MPTATSIAPWLSVSNGKKAIEFYKSAFGAVEVYHLESPDGDVVARLSVDGADFWISGAGAGSQETKFTGESPIRMILTVADPDAWFDRALKAGASEVFPVGEEYGWRLGRVMDPFGFHWEIGKQIDGH